MSFDVLDLGRSSSYGEMASIQEGFVTARSAICEGVHRLSSSIFGLFKQKPMAPKQKPIMPNEMVAEIFSYLPCHAAVNRRFTGIFQRHQHKLYEAVCQLPIFSQERLMPNVLDLRLTPTNLEQWDAWAQEQLPEEVYEDIKKSYTSKLSLEFFQKLHTAIETTSVATIALGHAINSVAATRFPTLTTSLGTSSTTWHTAQLIRHDLDSPAAVQGIQGVRTLTLEEPSMTRLPKELSRMNHLRILVIETSSIKTLNDIVENLPEGIESVIVNGHQITKEGLQVKVRHLPTTFLHINTCDDSDIVHQLFISHALGHETSNRDSNEVVDLQSATKEDPYTRESVDNVEVVVVGN